MSYYQSSTLPPRKKSKAMPILLGVLAFVVVACGGSMIAVAVVASPPKRPAATRAAGQEVAATQPTTPAAAPTTAAAKAPAGPLTSVEDGTYTVGAGPDNIAAGTYKVTGADKKCYWAIYKSGQNQDFSAMVNNHLGGGNLSVTLKAGQDFETKRCGTWKRAG